LKNYGWMQKDTILHFLNNLRDPASRQIRQKAEKVAGFDTGVLLYGETGTGKDFWADFIRMAGGRGRMVNLNCGDVPENLLESEWFGYSRGAFTGAENDRPGRWAAAGDGIIFLNQIDLLSLNMQSRLLRIIERKKYFPLGSTAESTVAARFLFSADQDIEDKVKGGKFRKDLYYRISAYAIHIPPLRERREDIIPLMEYFASQEGLEVSLTRKGKKRLMDHRWEGNIRELQNFVRNISITKAAIDDTVTETLQTKRFDPEQQFASGDLSLREMEGRYIRHLIKKYGNKSLVARILGISRKSLYDRMEKYGKD